MTKKKKKIVILGMLLALIPLMIVSAHARLWPACDYYGGFEMFGNTSNSSRCDCLGIKYFTVNEAPIDGISHSVCFGIRTEIK